MDGRKKLPGINQCLASKPILVKFVAVIEPFGSIFLLTI
jgi:hypothetical protein